MFATSSFTTGALTNASSLPTGVLYVNGTANAATVTVTNVTTGIYNAQVTLPTLSIGDLVSIVISATVGGVAGGGKVWEDSKDVLLDASGYVTFNNTTIANVTNGVTVITNNDKTGYSLTVTPPTVAQIDTQLSGAHGSGSWATATGFATPTNITAGTMSAVESIGAGGITSTSFAAGAITDAAIAFPAESSGRPTTFLAAMRRLWEWTANLRTRNRSTGNVEVFGADNVTLLETQVQSTTGSVDQQTKGS